MKNALKERRTEMRLTQKDVANQLGIKRQTYHNYEKGKRQPRIETMVLISRLFKKPVEELFFLPK